MKYCIASHVSYMNHQDQENFGPPHHVEFFLRKKDKSVVFIKHSLHTSHAFSQMVNEENQVRKFFVPFHKNMMLKVFFEILMNIVFIIPMVFKNEMITFIAVNPINGISGVILKKLGFIQKLIYFSADYTETRFSQKLLNDGYHVLDRLSVKGADSLWVISSRIATVRKKMMQGKKPLFILPNSPNFDPKMVLSGFRGYSFVIISHLTQSIPMKEVLEIIRLIQKKYKEVTLTVIGDGPERAVFQKKVQELNLEKNVTFFGTLSHDEILSCLSQFSFGFALYSQENSWNIYGDSMKAREYMAYGVPVIINTVPSTADDVKKYQAGLVFEHLDPEEISQEIMKYLKDLKAYEVLQGNAYRLAKDCSKDALLQKILL